MTNCVYYHKTISRSKHMNAAHHVLNNHRMLTGKTIGKICVMISSRQVKVISKLLMCNVVSLNYFVHTQV